MSRAEEYRRLAQQCLEMARTGSNPDSRPMLLHMAQVQESRPVVQQQQIQVKDGEKG